MYRTTIMLPEALKRALAREASREGTSFGALVREALQHYLVRLKGSDVDSFLGSQTVFTDDGPTDVAGAHDIYLVEDPH